MFYFSEKILGIMSSLFMICYGISFLCNDFKFVEPCYFLLGSIAVASFISDIVLFIFKGEK